MVGVLDGKVDGIFEGATDGKNVEGSDVVAGATVGWGVGVVACGCTNTFRSLKSGLLRALCRNSIAKSVSCSVTPLKFLLGCFRILVLRPLMLWVICLL